MTYFKVATSLTFLLFCWFGFTYLNGLQQNDRYLENTTAFSQAVAALDQKNYDQAIVFASPLEEVDGRSYEIQFLLGKSYFHTEKLSLAKIHFDQALDLYPYYVENEEFLILLALTNMKLEEVENVGTIYEVLKELHITPMHFSDFLKIQEYLIDRGL